LEKLNYQKFGPFTILKQINTMAFQFKLPYYLNIHPMLHVSLLQLYHVSTIPGRTHEPSPPIVVNGEKNMKLKKFYIQGYHIANSNMISTNVPKNKSKTY
jgi:hypothetical protein